MDKNYKIITVNHTTDEFLTLKDLEEQVNEFIKKGYIPLGAPQKNSFGYFQAIYKVPEKENKVI